MYMCVYIFLFSYLGIISDGSILILSVMLTTNSTKLKIIIFDKKYGSSASDVSSADDHHLVDMCLDHRLSVSIKLGLFSHQCPHIVLGQVQNNCFEF